MDEIANELKGLRMPSMAQSWMALVETRRADSLTLHDGLQILLQAERDGRRLNRNARLIRDAHFRYNATIEDVMFDSAKGIGQSRVMQLSTCEYIRHGIPVLITGAAGTGKSHLASALGHQACIMGYKVAYFNVQKLFEEIATYRIQAQVHRFFEKMTNTDLLILDDFGMKVLEGQQLLDFLELIEDRHGRKATIIVSQLPVANWYEILKANTTAADAILDRIVHTAQRFELKGESRRKK